MPVHLAVEMSQRDFATPLTFPEVEMEPVRYSWHRKGGPEFCEIRAYGSAWALWELVNWLRAPVRIVDDRGEGVWWGYSDEVTVGVGGVGLGLSLQSMANKVRVLYSTSEDGSPEQKELTPWTQDDDSVNTYGTFELVAELKNGSLEMAIAWRDQLLEQLKYPVPVVRHTTPRAGFGGMAGSTELTATIICRGWWFSLSWEHYKNDYTEGAETTAQIQYIAGTAQHIGDVDLQCASGVYTSQYREGTERRLEIVEALMEAGIENGEPMAAEVTRDRDIRIWEAPAKENPDVVYLLPDGRVADVWGNELRNHECPVAKWAVLRDVVPPTVAISRLADPSRYFVERSEYTVRNGQLIMEPRGQDSPWSATAVSAVAGGISPFVGRYEGPHAGLFRFKNADDGTWSVLLQASDTANLPFFSAGARNYKSNSKWLRMGYADRAHAYLKAPTGDEDDPEEHTDLVVIPMQPYKGVSANYTATVFDATVETTSAVTVTLPDAAPVAWRVYEIKNTSSGSTTVQGTGGDTIDGSSSATLTQHQSIRVQSNGANWIVLASK